jgi:hypothetical protein
MQKSDNREIGSKNWINENLAQEKQNNSNRCYAYSQSIKSFFLNSNLCPLCFYLSSAVKKDQRRMKSPDASALRELYFFFSLGVRSDSKNKKVKMITMNFNEKRNYA